MRSALSPASTARSQTLIEWRDVSIKAGCQCFRAVRASTRGDSGALGAPPDSGGVVVFDIGLQDTQFLRIRKYFRHFLAGAHAIRRSPRSVLPLAGRAKPQRLRCISHGEKFALASHRGPWKIGLSGPIPTCARFGRLAALPDSCLGARGLRPVWRPNAVFAPSSTAPRDGRCAAENPNSCGAFTGAGNLRPLFWVCFAGSVVWLSELCAAKSGGAFTQPQGSVSRWVCGNTQFRFQLGAAVGGGPSRRQLSQKTNERGLPWRTPLLDLRLWRLGAGGVTTSASFLTAGLGYAKMA